MLIIMRKGAQEKELEHVKELLIGRNFDLHQSTGANRTIIGVIGDTEALEDKEISDLPGVLQVVRITKEE